LLVRVSLTTKQSERANPSWQS